MEAQVMHLYMELEVYHHNNYLTFTMFIYKQIN